MPVTISTRHFAETWKKEIRKNANEKYITFYAKQGLVGKLQPEAWSG